MKVRFASVPSATAYAVIMFSDDSDAVIRKPTEAELEAGLHSWRWSGRNDPGYTQEFLTKLFTPHDSFWSNEDIKVVPSGAVARSPWDHNRKVRNAVMEAWIATRNNSIMFAISPDGQAVQTRNAALIAKAKQMNAEVA